MLKKKTALKNIKISFKFKSFHGYQLKLILPKILKKIQFLNIKHSNITTLPIKLQRFTVLRSPHIDKKSREQFEIRIYSKLITTFFNLENNFDKQKAKLLINFIKNSSAGIFLKITYKI